MTVTVEALDGLVDMDAVVPCCGSRMWCERGHAPAEYRLRFRCERCARRKSGLVCSGLRRYLRDLVIVVDSVNGCGGVLVLVSDYPV